MELRVRSKIGGGIFSCLPGFVNINLDGHFIVREGPREVVREIIDYEVFIPYDGIWICLNYAWEEGFLDSNQLRMWP